MVQLDRIPGRSYTEVTDYMVCTQRVSHELAEPHTFSEMGPDPRYVLGGEIIRMRLV